MSFRLRIMLAAAGAAVVSLLAAAAAAYSPAVNTLVSSLDNSLRTQAAAAVSQAEQGQALNIYNFYGARVHFWPANVSSTGSHLPVTTQVRAMAHRPVGSVWFTTVVVHGVPLRELVETMPPNIQIETNNGPLVLGADNVMQLATLLTNIDQQASHLKEVLTLVALGGIALAVALGLLVARRMLVPLDDLTGRVERLAETTDVSERLDPGGADELGRLRRAFNHLLGALEASRESQRQLVLDASHELRTPLTSLRTNLEVVRRVDELAPSDRQVLIDDVLTQLQELTDLVSDLAELARGEAPAAEPRVFRLDRLVEDAIAVAATHGRARAVTFAPSLTPTWVRARRDRLARAIGNLLDNALKWSPPGGSVEVTCAAGTVSVRDHGPGIAPEDLSHVFDRFWRSPAARALPGSGLGLAIVAQAVAAEGGKVEAMAALGEGSIFRISLPEVKGPGPGGEEADDESGGAPTEAPVTAPAPETAV